MGMIFDFDSHELFITAIDKGGYAFKPFRERDFFIQKLGGFTRDKINSIPLPEFKRDRKKDAILSDAAYYRNRNKYYDINESAGKIELKETSYPGFIRDRKLPIEDIIKTFKAYELDGKIINIEMTIV